MKKVILFLILLLFISMVSATTNLDFRLDVEEKGFYPNEKIPLNVTLVNRDSTFSARDAILTVNIGERFYTFDLGDMKPGETFEKEIILPEFPAGTHTIKGEINYTGILDEKFVETTYGSFEVLFPPIERYPRNVYVSGYDLPEKIIGGKPYDVSITITNDGDVDADLLIEFGSIDEFFTEKAKLASGKSITVKLNVKFDNPGVSLIETRAYALIKGEKYLLNYRGKKTYVQAERKAKLSFDSIELVEEGDNAINQEDTVKFKVFIKNEGDTATDVNGVITSNVEGIDVLDTDVSYVTIASKDSLAPSDDIFEIETKDIETGEHELSLKLSYVDSENREKEIKIPISISEGGDKCTKDTDCLDTQACKDNKCVDISCESGEIINHKCQLYECYENSQCSKDSVCDIITHSCKSSGAIKIIVLDPQLSKSISRASVYIDDKYKGMTNEKGIFQASLMPRKYSIKVKAKGYDESIKEIMISETDITELKFSLSQFLERTFDIPKGFEGYIYGKKASYSYIHPQEKKLMSYSFPILSSTELDVAKDLIKKVDTFINYDHSCLQKPRPSTCQAWHKQEYNIIETHKGVCADWAVLGTSFSNSYGIPSRYTRGCWKKKSLTGAKKLSCHAWQEVYLPGLGWKHMDTLWNAFDDPCVYVKGMSVKCFTDGRAYDPETQSWIARDVYTCGKPCSESDYSKEYTDALEFKEATGADYYYFIDLNTDSALISFSQKLTKEESSEIRELNKKETLDKDKIKELLISIAEPQFKNLGEIKDTEIILENLYDSSKLVIATLKFKVIFSDKIKEYNHEFTISQYSSVDYTIKTPLSIVSVYPTTLSKEILQKNKQFKWHFDRAGTHNIKLQLAKEKIGFLIIDEPEIEAIANIVSNKIEGKVYKINQDYLSGLKEYKPSLIYILGKHTDISSDVEDNLKSIFNVQRQTEEDYILISVLVATYWQQSDELVVADLYDFDSIKKAEQKSLEKKIPLLFIKENEIPSVTSDIIKQLKVKTILFSDPNLKVSGNIKSQLNDLAEVEELTPKLAIHKLSSWQKFVYWIKSLFR